MPQSVKRTQKKNMKMAKFCYFEKSGKITFFEAFIDCIN